MGRLKVILSGGGTGGHIFPAIAVANALKNTVEGVEVLFVGAEGKMEMEKVPSAGYKIEGLPIRGIARKLTLKNFQVVWRLWQSIRKAKKIIKKFSPDVVVGFGGYASGPLLYVASRKGPTLIQEQNSYPGITNKLLAKKTKKICVAYEGMDRFFPKEKILLTGNPVRQLIKNIPEKRARGLEFFGFDSSRKTVLVIGGSLGARTINESIHHGLDRFCEEGIQVLWQCGKFYKDKVSDICRDYKDKGVVVVPFIDKMDYAYAVADIVVSRAGAISVAELCVVQKPVVLVPSPNVAEDHQTKNAEALVNNNAAILVKDVVAKKVLVDNVLLLLSDDVKQEQMSRNIAGMAFYDAADRIAQEIVQIAKA